MTRPYQSFPGARGASDSKAKLQALKLPALEGKSFLDVGCNAGFFSGFAQFSGAGRVVGIDAREDFISAAKTRFPEIDFRCQSWDKLPDEKFDVILLSSALHYAEDQPALIDRIMGHLSEGGLFVLEAGIAEGKEEAWVQTKRGSIDTRIFPTMRMMSRILGKYSYRMVGPSTNQRNDPNPRYVFHIRVKLPYALLLLDSPRSGKTYFARWLAAKNSGEQVIHADRLALAVSNGKCGSASLQGFIQSHWTSPQAIRSVVDALYKSGMWVAFLELVVEQASRRDFIFDGYVPEAYRATVAETLACWGFVPVIVSVQAPGRVRSGSSKKCEAYLADLLAKQPAGPERKSLGLRRVIRRVGASIFEALRRIVAPAFRPLLTAMRRLLRIVSLVRKVWSTSGPAVFVVGEETVFVINGKNETASRFTANPTP